jgi:nucleotide-binding universal stress UspA family protein
MAHTCDGGAAPGRDRAPWGGRSRPMGSIMLATLVSTPFDERAAELALELAIERPAELVVANIVEYPVGGRGPRADLGDPPDAAASLRAPVEAGAAAGVTVTALRIRSLRPASTLLGVVSAHEPSVVVFGPDLARLSALRGLSRRRYRRALRMLEVGASCLLWAPAPTHPDLRPRRRSSVAAVASRRLTVPGRRGGRTLRRVDIWW